VNTEQVPAAAGENEAEITLGLLNAVEANSALTQRTVARDLGIALGLANAYLKRCVRKGLIKVTQIPANRYAYYLTPKGFAEKSRLTAEYLTISFNFFRAARTQCAAEFERCKTHGWTRVGLAGIGDLAEIATLCAADANVRLVGIWDPESNIGTFAGLRVVAQPGELYPCDAFLVTDFRQPQATYDALVRQVSPERVLTPKLLSISRSLPTLATEDEP
jgi:DNA-binding MarR family transcriptional regulator